MKELLNAEIITRVETIFIPKYKFVQVEVSKIMGDYMNVEVSIHDAPTTSMLELITGLNTSFLTPILTIAPLKEGYLTKVAVTFLKPQTEELLETLTKLV